MSNSSTSNPEESGTKVPAEPGTADATEIICILDRSGSMEAIRSDAIGGFNRFLAGQQEPEDPARMTVVLFDDRIELLHNAVPVRKIPPLDDRTFVPRGMTALLDAIGVTVNALAARLAEMPAAYRPKNVIVAILTDGCENASHQFTHAMVRDLIGRYTEMLGWDFVFLAAHADAFAEGEKMGISQDNTMTCDVSDFSCCYDSISKAVASKRRTGKVQKDWKEPAGS